MTIRTPDLCDAYPQAQVVQGQWRHYGARTSFFGPVATLRCPDDNSKVRAMLQTPGEGRVLVVDAGGWPHHSMLGDQLARLACDNGWAGVVVHGMVRDVEELAGMDCGIVALGSVPRKTDKHGRGEEGVALAFGGARIAPGCWLYADLSGVVVAEGPIHEG